MNRFFRLPLLLWAICVFVGSSSLLRADPAATPKPASGPFAVWLGDPGVDPVAARARSRKDYTDSLHWVVADDLAAYDSAGKKDPRWDDDARESLRQATATLDLDPKIARAANVAQKEACQRAIKVGCDDPLVRYWALRLSLYPSGISPDDLARLYARAESELEASDYHPIHKFFAATRTAEKILACRHATDGTVGQQHTGYKLDAVSWPNATNITNVYRHGLNELKLVLQNPAIPVRRYFDMMNNFVEAAASDPIGRAEVLVPLAAFFEGDDWKKQQAYGAKACEGQFWTTYAWDARGGGWANSVTDDGWRFFGERLKNAATAYETAWKLDPTGFEAPCGMLTVTMGRESESGDLDTWFRRAMDATPDTYAAGSRKLTAIEPKWGGSEEEMLTFGRQCLATQDWDSRMPFIVLETHYRLAKNYSSDAAAYWKKPEVWADLHQLYGSYLEANPDADYDRTFYALYAFRAEDWKTAHEQFERVGDHPDEAALQHEKIPGRQFQDMRRTAAERAKDSGDKS